MNSNLCTLLLFLKMYAVQALRPEKKNISKNSSKDWIYHDIYAHDAI